MKDIGQRIKIGENNEDNQDEDENEHKEEDDGEYIILKDPRSRKGGKW